MMLESALEALLLLFSWPYIIYPIAGTVLAMVFSFLPGLNGATLMALAIPWTLGWDPLSSIIFFAALVGGGTFMGSVTAILFNIPGTSPNAATMFDGYPMALRGEAKTAIACSATASALGATVGVVLLIALIPAVRHIVLAVGPPELLLLAVWGLTTVALVSRKAVLKGLIAAGLGLLVGFVGLDPRTAELRFTLGLEYLSDGIPVIPVFLGLFALAEMIDLHASGKQSVADRDVKGAMGGSTREGILSVFRNPGLFLRSSLLGTLIGIIPGIGGTVASFVAYGHAAQGRGGERFGEGDIRGVLAPEAANDAKDGGSLLPVLAFGIPGSESTVMLLAAMTLHGINPGPELINSELTLVFTLIWSLLLANWLTSIFGIGVSERFARLTLVPARLLIPVILVLVVLAALVQRASYGDLVLTVFFGGVGFAMKRLGWPRVSFVLALVLASLFETNLHLTMRLAETGRFDPMTRPVFLALLLLVAGTFAWSISGRLRARRS